MLTNPAPDVCSPVQPCCLSVCNTGVREPQEVRRTGVTKGLLILLGIGIVIIPVSHQCPRSSARIEQRPPEPCVGRSNRLGGTSSQLV